MLHADDRFAEAVTATVGEIETTTDAEIVVVATERAGRYDDVAAYVAAVVTALALAFLLFSPWTFGPGWVLVDAALVFGLSWMGARRHPWLPRLTSRARRRHEVEAAAHGAVLAEAVHATPNRSGVMVYVAAQEAEVVVWADLGVEGRIPRGRLRPVADRLDAHDLDAFLAGLVALGTVLAEHLPHTDDSDATDLPNAPRVHP